MKYLTLLSIVFLMYWSWAAVQSERPVPESIHVGIQEDLKQIIQDYVTKELPDSDNLEFEKLWTETVSDTQVKASFTYSFDDLNESTGQTRVQINGYALLNREHSDNKEEVWSFDELYVVDNNVEYKIPLTIKSSPEEDE